jgi:hypothetical protein
VSALEFDEFDAPEHWASALFNGDFSGFSDDDQTEFDAWFADSPEMLNVVGCSDESFIGRFNGLQTDLLTYTYQVVR